MRMAKTIRNRQVNERIINIFVYGNPTHVYAVGWRVYEKTGTYEELIAFLQAKAIDDHRIAARQDLDEPLLLRDFGRVAPGDCSPEALSRTGQGDFHHRMLSTTYDGVCGELDYVAKSP